MAKERKCPYYVVNTQQEFDHVMKLLGGNTERLYPLPCIVGEDGIVFQNRGTVAPQTFCDQKEDRNYVYERQELVGFTPTPEPSPSDELKKVLDQLQCAQRLHEQGHNDNSLAIHFDVKIAAEELERLIGNKEAVDSVRDFLEMVANPVEHTRKRLKPGERENGRYLADLSERLSTVSDDAKKALESYNKVHMVS